MADTETTSMNLMNDVTVNGRTYKAGRNVAVPKAQADDISRIDYDRQAVVNKLVMNDESNSRVRI